MGKRNHKYPYIELSAGSESGFYYVDLYISKEIRCSVWYLIYVGDSRGYFKDKEDAVKIAEEISKKINVPWFEETF